VWRECCVSHSPLLPAPTGKKAEPCNQVLQPLRQRGKAAVAPGLEPQFDGSSAGAEFWVVADGRRAAANRSYAKSRSGERVLDQFAISNFDQ
jgi:hypothetical protein